MSKLLPMYLVHQAVFLATGVLIFVSIIKAREIMSSAPTETTIAPILLLKTIPQTEAIANGILILVTFVLGLPALILPSNTKLLRIYAWMVVVCAIFTLTLGLIIWVSTLGTRQMLAEIWERQSIETQGLLQTRFECCGYYNSTSPHFVTNDACPSVHAAAQTQGCVRPFAAYGNWFLQMIFTSLFGIVAADAFVIIVTSMMVSWRNEQARYRYIDGKHAIMA